MGTALYIGRFQPFHKGHLDVVRYIDSELDVDKIIIAIGSSQYNDKNPNPYSKRSRNVFTYEERKEMLENSLRGQLNNPFEIHPLMDFHNYPRWYNHLMKSVPHFDFYYTVSKREREWFESKGHDVRDFPVLYDFHATKIRNWIFNGEDYRATLPAGTLQVLDKARGVERICEAYALDISEELKTKKDS